MTRHLGQSYALSVLIVVLCAIGSYRPEAPPRPGRPPNPAPGHHVARAPAPAEGRPAEEPVEGDAVRKPVVAARAEPASPALVTRVAGPVGPPPSATTRTVARPSPRARTQPRGAFARVEAGETLPDLARRVYGSPAMAEALWRANRDQLPAAESRLEVGMLLRTP